MRSARPVDVARGALGVAALTRPDLFLRLSPGRAEDGTWVRRTVRILGARYVVQSAGGFALHRPWVPEVDATVDLIHAASMLGLAVLAPAHRNLTLLSAAAAAAFAVADLSGRPVAGR